MCFENLWEKLMNVLAFIIGIATGVALPFILGLWILGMIVEVIIQVGNSNYNMFIRYAEICLTLFGFCLVGGIFEEKAKKIFKNLFMLAIIFLFSGICFFITHSLSFIVERDIGGLWGGVIAGVWLGALIVAFICFVYGILSFFQELLKYWNKKEKK